MVSEGRRELPLADPVRRVLGGFVRLDVIENLYREVRYKRHFSTDTSSGVLRLFCTK